MQKDAWKKTPYRVVEMYYTVAELSCLLRFSEQWVRDRIHAGDFGPHALNVRGDLRVPASAVNAFLEQFEMPSRGSPRRSAACGIRRAMTSVPDESYEAVLCSFVLEHVDDCHAAVAECRRVLAPGGAFHFALFGEKTLHVLRGSYHRAYAATRQEDEKRTHTFPVASAVEAGLDRSGFAECRAWSEFEIEFYPNVLALLRAIRGVGAGTTSPPTTRGLSERRVMLDMMERHKAVFGGVAIVDTDSPNVKDRMRALKKRGVRGFRIYPSGNARAWLDSPAKPRWHLRA